MQIEKRRKIMRGFRLKLIQFEHFCIFTIIVNDKRVVTHSALTFSKTKSQMPFSIPFHARKLAFHSIPKGIDLFFLKSIRLRATIHLFSLIGLKTVWENMIYFNFKRFRTVLAIFCKIFSDFVS